MALTAGSNFAIPLSAMLTAPVLARGLGVEGRGALAASIAPLMLMISVSGMGMQQSILYHTALRPLTAWRNVRAGLRVLLVSGIVGGLLTVVLSGWLSDGNAQVQRVILVVAVIIPLTIYCGALRGAASGLQRWGLVALEKSANGGIRLVIIYALWLTGHMTVLAAALGIALPGLVSCLAYLPLMRLPRGRASQAPCTRELSRYGVKIWGGSVSGILMSRLDQAIMAPLAGITQLSYYTVAVNVSDIVGLANNAMRDVTLASDAADNDNRRLFLTARLSLVLALVVAVLIGTTMWLWFDLLFGAEFRSATWSILILLIATACGTPGSVVGAGLSARGHPGLRSWSLAVGLAVNVVALIALAPAIGAIGAACATFLANVTASQLNIIWFLRRFGGTWRECFCPRSRDLRRLRSSVYQLIHR